MRVTVRLYGQFARYRHEDAAGPVALETPIRSTVGDILRQLGIPPDTPRVMSVNGVVAAPDDPLRPGDELLVAPVAAGG
jgi:sulfur carrier protein ThiS